MEGREEGSRRWITVKIVEELKHMLRDCELHSPAIDTRTIAENYPTAKCNECEWQGPRDQLMSGASPLDELCPRCTSEDTEWVEAK
jgi:Zn finger protein HypA/HybF involved in hydrogenase expression